MATHTFAYSIKNQWLNMSLYFINFMYRTRKPFGDTLVGKLIKSIVLIRIYAQTLISKPNPIILIDTTKTIAGQFYTTFNSEWNEQNIYVCKYITKPNRLKDNSDLLGGRQRNSKWFASGDYIKTKFIKLDKTDIITFFGNNDNGFAYNKNKLNNPTNYYRQSNTSSNFNTNITNQERDDTNQNIYNNDNLYYFLKATNNNDIIKFLIGAGII